MQEVREAGITVDYCSTPRDKGKWVDSREILEIRLIRLANK